MTVLTANLADARMLGAQLERKQALLVVCLCAAWCDTCRDFHAVFTRLAEANATTTFVWLDVEDDSMLVSDIDLESFPTLAVFRGGEPLFFGVTRPQASVVTRTLASLTEAGARPIAVPEAVAALQRALAEHARNEATQ